MHVRTTVYLCEKDGSLAVFVSPTIVPLSSPLSSAKGPVYSHTYVHTYENDNVLTCGYAGSGIMQGNMVLLNSANLTSSTFAGPGAGRFPTANSVMNDLIRISLVSCIYCMYVCM